MDLAPHPVRIAVPSPHSPSKTGVNALMAGEGSTVVQRSKLGEGFCATKEPLTQFFALRERVALSHKGRGHKYANRNCRNVPVNHA
jgi:hypothetical protein